MRLLEIITIRSVGNIPKPLISNLLSQIEQTHTAEKPVAIKMYHHSGVNTDVSIHLHWRSISGSQGKSSLGMMLSHTLRDFGLLNHSIWIEEKQS
jgi:UDP-N-acetylmuramoylalanine-D-glutamate ligase